MTTLIRYFLLALILLTQSLPALCQSTLPRPLTPKDLLKTWSIGAVALSPDDRWIAAVVQRPRTPGEYYRSGLGGNNRADIWLVSTDGREQIKVTNGALAHAGWWEPVWSPDSRRLAMLSTEGSDTVRVWTYELATSRMRRLSPSSVDLGLRIQLKQSRLGPLAWFDSTSLLVGLLPPDRRPLAFDELERTAMVAARGAAAAKRGTSSTVHILTSGDPEPPLPKESVDAALTIINVKTGAQRTLVQIPVIEARLSQRIVCISPTLEYAGILATEKAIAASPKLSIRLDQLLPMRFGVVTLNDKTNSIQWLEGVRPALFGLGANPVPMRWAAANPWLAFVGLNVSGNSVPSAFVVKQSGKQWQAVNAHLASDRLLTAEDVEWTNDDRLLVYGYAGTLAEVRSEDERREVTGFARDNSISRVRRDWWLVNSNGSFKNLTARIPSTPRRLLFTRNLILGAGSGRLWKLDLTDGSVVQVSLEDNWAIGQILGSNSGNPTANSPDDLLVVSPAKIGSDLYVAKVEGTEATARRIGSIPDGASIREYSARSRFTIYQTTDTRLMALRVDNGKEKTLISLNRELDEIAKPEYRNFEYTTDNGSSLSGALLLPYGYVPGRRYPMIVSVYGGSLAPRGDWASPYRNEYPHPLLLSAHGYVVLIPSVPLERMGIASDPMLDLEKGVLPAIDKVVEMGFADPERIGLIGLSYGGYSVYGLITQTSRFKAAVALGGVTDLFALYGSLDPRYRFSTEANSSWGSYTVESQQFRMGAAPWTDPLRYLRNSPVMHADKVTTPILMIHGDLDVLPLNQAEEFFVALSRLGKRSKLVRYLGEGHSIESPANALDMWGHIFGWLDEFLQKPNHNSSTARSK